MGPAPTGGIAPLHLYRCTNADDKDSSWEINMDDVDTSGADCLRDGMCVHFAEDYVKGMVEVYEADVDMSGWRNGYCMLRHGRKSNEACGGSATFGFDSYSQETAAVFWRLSSDITGIVVKKRTVYEINCFFDAIGCPSGKCSSLTNSDLVKNLV